MSADHFDELAKDLATTSTRRRALGVMAGGVATLWGLMRSPVASARFQRRPGPRPCPPRNQECWDPRECRCVLPHWPGRSICLRPDQCQRLGGYCAGSKK